MIILEMLSITLTATILIISAAILFLRKKTTKCLHSIPGPRVFPIVGNALQLADKTKFLNRLLQWHHQFGDRYLFSIGPTNTLVLADLKDLKTVLESQSLLSKGHAYYFTRSWLGNGLLVSKGNKWRIRRKILTPAFHFKILELFQSVSNEQSMILVKLMKRKHEKCEPCLIHNMISLCALGIICDAALGTRLRCQEESSVYTQAVMKQSEYIFNRLISPWFHNNYIWSRWGHGEAEKKNLAILNDFIHQIIVERKTMYKKSKKNLDIGGNEPLTAERLAFLDLLIEIQSKTETSLTDDDIYEETATFTFEGHDTTAAGLTWTLYLLSKHPEYQESVHDELKTIFGSDRSRPITASDLTKMKYLECCIKESLRLYPSVPNVTRTVEHDFRLDENTVIPAGINILISPWVIHRKSELYPDPEKFIPERHTPENYFGRNPYAFLPFLAGSRNCIGQKVALAELKTVLGNIFRNFKVSLANPQETVKPLPELIVRPKNDIAVLLEFK